MKIRHFLTLVLAAILIIGVVQQATPAQEGELKFAITAAVCSDPSFANYRELTNYIADRIGKKSAFVSGLTYNQVDNLFLKGQVDVGFLCNTHYARRNKAVGFEPIAAPIIIGYDKPKFQVYIIVHKDSKITSIGDLRGKSIDLADPLSTTTIYAADMLLKKNEKIKSYFGKAIYSGSHDMTIQLVANKMVDAGFIDGHIWDYHDKVRPEFSSKTKVIHKSPDFTIPPVVVQKAIDKALKERITRILLTMHEDARGKEVLKKLRIYKFIEIKDKDYKDVLEMYNRVKDRI